jgi:hypothetical protein
MAVQLITIFVAPCLYCMVTEWQFKELNVLNCLLKPTIAGER